MRTPPKAVSLDPTRRRAERQARPLGLRPRDGRDGGHGLGRGARGPGHRSASWTSRSRRAGWWSVCASGTARTSSATPGILTAARAHGSGPFLARLEAREVEAHMPLIDRHRRTGRVLARDAFTHEQASDACTCPQGASLRRYGPNDDPQCCRASQRDCGACPIKASCTKGKMRAPPAARPTRPSASGCGPGRTLRPCAARCGCARGSSTCSPTIRAPRRAPPPQAERPARRRRAVRARRCRPQPSPHGPSGRTLTRDLDGIGVGRETPATRHAPANQAPPTDLPATAESYRRGCVMGIWGGRRIVSGIGACLELRRERHAYDPGHRHPALPPGRRGRRPCNGAGARGRAAPPGGGALRGGGCLVAAFAKARLEDGPRRPEPVAFRRRPPEGDLAGRTQALAGPRPLRAQPTSTSGPTASASRP